MKVYIVFGDYQNGWGKDIVAVYTDKIRAQFRAEHLKNSSEPNASTYWVEEFEVTL